MTNRNRVAWTKWMVLVGIFLGYVSYGTGKLGIGELYPFADWRLFSAPIGINEAYATYRVYYRRHDQEDWQRHPNVPSKAFTRKELSYAIGYWSRRIESPMQDKARRALKALATHLIPEADQYRIVAESLYALPYLEDTTRYDTSTVAAFNR